MWDCGCGFGLTGASQYRRWWHSRWNSSKDSVIATESLLENEAPFHLSKDCLGSPRPNHLYTDQEEMRLTWSIDVPPDFRTIDSWFHIQTHHQSHRSRAPKDHSHWRWQKCMLAMWSCHAIEQTEYSTGKIHVIGLHIWTSILDGTPPRAWTQSSQQTLGRLVNDNRKDLLDDIEGEVEWLVGHGIEGGVNTNSLQEWISC